METHGYYVVSGMLHEKVCESRFPGSIFASYCSLVSSPVSMRESRTRPNSSKLMFTALLLKISILQEVDAVVIHTFIKSYIYIALKGKAFDLEDKSCHCKITAIDVLDNLCGIQSGQAPASNNVWFCMLQLSVTR